MKHKTNIISLFLLLLAWVLPLLIPATAAASTTNLVTLVPMHVALKVEINGKGTVMVGDYKLKKTGKVQIPRNQEMRISFQPGTGYELSSVELNGREVTEQMRDGKLIIAGSHQDRVLSVLFRRSSSIGSEINPQTGDQNIFSFIAVLCLTAFMLPWMIYRMRNTK